MVLGSSAGILSSAVFTMNAVSSSGRISVSDPLFARLDSGWPAGGEGPYDWRDLLELSGDSNAGYSAAVSCEPGVNGPQSDRFTLRRRQIDSRDRLLDFKAKVGGGHDTPLPLRGAYRRLRYGMRDAAPQRASSRA